MSTEDNKALLRQFYEEVLNQHNLAAMEKYIAPDCMDHTLPPGMPQGIEGVKMFTSIFLTAFPDIRNKAEDMIAEGDKVVARISFDGTHQGAFQGIPPTGKQVKVPGIDIVRISGGKIVEHWSNFDQMGMLQQLGVIPAPGG